MLIFPLFPSIHFAHSTESFRLRAQAFACPCQILLGVLHNVAVLFSGLRQQWG